MACEIPRGTLRQKGERKSAGCDQPWCRPLLCNGRESENRDPSYGGWRAKGETGEDQSSRRLQNKRARGGPQASHAIEEGIHKKGTAETKTRARTSVRGHREGTKTRDY